MLTVICIAVLGSLFYISSVNYIFRKAKYRNMTREEKRKLNIFNSPNAWIIYSTIIAIIIGVIFFKSLISIFIGYSGVAK